MAQRCLVIGGGGFLGQHLVEKLLNKGYEVSVFDVRTTPGNDSSVTTFVGNLCNKEDLQPALKGVDIVFHCATPSPLSGNRQVFLAVNYEGTKTVVAACRAAGVKKVILTSSASVVYEGRDISNGNESLPYAQQPLDFYTETKILQEKIVLAANSDAMCTVAVRPHGIFGPHDPHMLPTTCRMARAGKTKFIIGDGSNKVDFTYIDNVVEGHILAAEAIAPGSKLGGKAYNLTNDEPVLFWTFMTRLITGLGYPAPRYHLPYWLIYAVAVLIYFVCSMLKPLGICIQPTFTPMTVALAGTHHYYSCQRAKSELGYRPVVSMDEGIKRTLAHFQHLAKDSTETRPAHGKVN